MGITNNLARRAAEHLASEGIQIEKLLGPLTRAQARSVEQALIEIHKLGKNGGALINKINAVARSNPEYAKMLEEGVQSAEVDRIQVDGKTNGARKCCDA